MQNRSFKCVYFIKVIYKFYFVTGATQCFKYLLNVILPIQTFINSQTKKFYSFIKLIYALLINTFMYVIRTCGNFINDRFTMHRINNVKTGNFIFLTYLMVYPCRKLETSHLRNNLNYILQYFRRFRKIAKSDY
jgi:hypothetical protein